MQVIIVVPHDVNWAAAFKVASLDVASALGDNLLAIHHIGSTAIPGIHAKPIIDMLPVVADLAAVDTQTLPLAALGYTGRGEFGIPGRRYFVRSDATGARTHQMHVFQRGSAHIGRHLAFRDFLRAHPHVASEYSDLKRRLAAAHSDDIEAYMDGKDGFIKQVEADALCWINAREVNA